MASRDLVDPDLPEARERAIEALKSHLRPRSSGARRVRAQARRRPGVEVRGRDRRLLEDLPALPGEERVACRARPASAARSWPCSAARRERAAGIRRRVSASASCSGESSSTSATRSCPRAERLSTCRASSAASRSRSRRTWRCRSKAQGSSGASRTAAAAPSRAGSRASRSGDSPCSAAWRSGRVRAPPDEGQAAGSRAEPDPPYTRRFF